MITKNKGSNTNKNILNLKEIPAYPSLRGKGQSDWYKNALMIGLFRPLFGLVSKYCLKLS